MLFFTLTRASQDEPGSSSSGERPLRPLFNPETVPHDPTFQGLAARGPAVEAARLRPRIFSERFARRLRGNPNCAPTRACSRSTMEPTPAAVLVPLVVRGDDVQVLLTQRTAHLSDHAGQISFPGGRVEERDANPIATALRETEEEIGLGAGRVDVVGAFPNTRPSPATASHRWSVWSSRAVLADTGQLRSRPKPSRCRSRS